MTKPRVTDLRDLDVFGTDFNLLVGDGQALLIVHARLAHRYVTQSEAIRHEAPTLVRCVRALGEVYVLAFVAALALAALALGVESAAGWLAGAGVVVWFTDPLTDRWDSRYREAWGITGWPYHTAVATGVLATGALVAFGWGLRLAFALTLFGLGVIHLALILLPAGYVRRLALTSPTHRAALVDAGAVDVQLTPPN